MKLGVIKCTVHELHREVDNWMLSFTPKRASLNAVKNNTYYTDFLMYKYMYLSGDCAV